MNDKLNAIKMSNEVAGLAKYIIPFCPGFYAFISTNVLSTNVNMEQFRKETGKWFKTRDNIGERRIQKLILVIVLGTLSQV